MGQDKSQLTPSIAPPGDLRDTNPSFDAAAASIVFLFAALTLFNNHPIADEGLHLLAVERLVDGDWSHPEFLPMPLTYHLLVYLPAKVFGVEVWVLRLVSTAFSVALLWVLRSIDRVRKNRDSGLLHVVWLPVLFPFTALAYTEVASLLLLLAGVLLHLRKKPAWSAIPLAGACLVRQSNVVWIALMAVWCALEVWQRDRGDWSAETRHPIQRRIRQIVSKVFPHLAILIAAAVFFVVNGGFSIAAIEANRFRFNSAQLYLFALFLVGLWGPIWVPTLAADFLALGRWLQRKPRSGGTVVLLSLMAAVGAIATYWNPHEWNHNTDYLRNWPLLLMEQSLIVRGLAALLVLVALPGLVRRAAQAPNRTMLLLAWGFSFAYLVPHSLVDPRYYILPLVFLQFFSRFQRDEARRLTIWYGIVSAAVSGYVIIAGHRLGGVW